MCEFLKVFKRSAEASAEMEELARRANPDEINIAEEDDEEINTVEGMLLVTSLSPSLSLLYCIIIIQG